MTGVQREVTTVRLTQSTDERGKVRVAGRQCKVKKCSSDLASCRVQELAVVEIAVDEGPAPYAVALAGSPVLIPSLPCPGVSKGLCKETYAALRYNRLLGDRGNFMILSTSRKDPDASSALYDNLSHFPVYAHGDDFFEEPAHSWLFTEEFQVLEVSGRLVVIAKGTNLGGAAGSSSSTSSSSSSSSSWYAYDPAHDNPVPSGRFQSVYPGVHPRTHAVALGVGLSRHQASRGCSIYPFQGLVTGRDVFTSLCVEPAGASLGVAIANAASGAGANIGQYPATKKGNPFYERKDDLCTSAAGLIAVQSAFQGDLVDGGPRTRFEFLAPLIPDTRPLTLLTTAQFRTLLIPAPHALPEFPFVLLPGVDKPLRSGDELDLLRSDYATLRLAMPSTTTAYLLIPVAFLGLWRADSRYRSWITQRALAAVLQPAKSRAASAATSAVGAKRARTETDDGTGVTKYQRRGSSSDSNGGGVGGGGAAAAAAEGSVVSEDEDEDEGSGSEARNSHAEQAASHDLEQVDVYDFAPVSSSSAPGPSLAPTPAPAPAPPPFAAQAQALAAPAALPQLQSSADASINALFDDSAEYDAAYIEEAVKKLHAERGALSAAQAAPAAAPPPPPQQQPQSRHDQADLHALFDDSAELDPEFIEEAIRKLHAAKEAQSAVIEIDDSPASSAAQPAGKTAKAPKPHPLHKSLAQLAREEQEAAGMEGREMVSASSASSAAAPQGAVDAEVACAAPKDWERPPRRPAATEASDNTIAFYICQSLPQMDESFDRVVTSTAWGLGDYSWADSPGELHPVIDEVTASYPKKNHRRTAEEHKALVSAVVSAAASRTFAPKSGELQALQVLVPLGTSSALALSAGLLLVAKLYHLARWRYRDALTGGPTRLSKDIERVAWVAAHLEPRVQSSIGSASSLCRHTAGIPPLLAAIVAIELFPRASAAGSEGVQRLNALAVEYFYSMATADDGLPIAGCRGNESTSVIEAKAADVPKSRVPASAGAAAAAPGAHLTRAMLTAASKQSYVTGDVQMRILLANQVMSRQAQLETFARLIVQAQLKADAAMQAYMESADAAAGLALDDGEDAGDDDDDNDDRTAANEAPARLTVYQQLLQHAAQLTAGGEQTAEMRRLVKSLQEAESGPDETLRRQMCFAIIQAYRYEALEDARKRAEDPLFVEGAAVRGADERTYGGEGADLAARTAAVAALVSICNNGLNLKSDRVGQAAIRIGELVGAGVSSIHTLAELKAAVPDTEVCNALYSMLFTYSYMPVSNLKKTVGELDAFIALRDVESRKVRLKPWDLEAVLRSLARIFSGWNFFAGQFLLAADKISAALRDARMKDTSDLPSLSIAAGAGVAEDPQPGLIISTDKDFARYCRHPEVRAVVYHYTQGVYRPSPEPSTIEMDEDDAASLIRTLEEAIESSQGQGGAAAGAVAVGGGYGEDDDLYE